MKGLLKKVLIPSRGRQRFAQGSLQGIRFLTLTHVQKGKDGEPDLPKMVDVSEKAITHRVATAQGRVYLPLNVVEELALTSMTHSQNVEIFVKKGPVISTAIVAGVMAVKKTADLIPFCHSIPIDGTDISIRYKVEKQPTEEASRHYFDISCTVKTYSKTGVEMEALVGVSNTALCIYDMLKALSHEIVISDIALVAKEGGKSKFVKKS